jgi:integrase
MRLKVHWINGWAYAHGTAPGGARIRRALKTQNPRQAEEARARLETRLWKADIYGMEAVVTFAECALRYAEDGGEARFLVTPTERLGGKLLRDITPKMVRDQARVAYPEASAATINRQFIVPARAVINYGHEQGWCPPIKVRGLEVEKPKRKAVGRAYLDAIKPHLPLRLYALVLFLHQTGRRVGEALALTPAQLMDGRAFIPKTKNGQEAWAHLTPELRALLIEVEPRHGFVFGYLDRSSVYSTLRRAAKAAGVEYLGTHQLGRHSFATTLSAAGWGAKAIADAGGWKTTRMVSETYEHPQEPQAKAAALFGRHLAKAQRKARKTPNPS